MRPTADHGFPPKYVYHCPPRWPQTLLIFEKSNLYDNHLRNVQKVDHTRISFLSLSFLAARCI